MEIKKITKNELKNIRSTRRGIYASKIFLKIKFKKSDLILLRPETKLKVEDTHKVIGKK